MPGPARLLAAVLLASAVTLMATGCFGGSGRSKAGVGSPGSLTLTMPAADGDDPDAAFFASQAEARSSGRIRIAVDGTSYTNIDPDNELRLVRDLRAGTVPLAYVPSRAWERDGVGSLRVLQAPFLISDYSMLRQITGGTIGESMLASFDEIGLVGLALVPKELRRPLGRRPLTTVSAFRAARIRVLSSPAGELALRSLGARPLGAFEADEVYAALRQHELDGVESDVHAIAANRYTNVAPYLTTNLPLFAKAQTLVIRKDVLARLSGSDQAALRAAADATVAHADPAALERAELKQLCGVGVRLVEAAPKAVTALRRASRRAYEHDPSTRQAIAAIEALETAADSALPPCPAVEPGDTAMTTDARFPEGRFESRLTPGDFEAGGSQPDPDSPSPFQITMRDGRWRTNEQPSFRGRYVVRGHEVTFAIEQPPDAAGNRETLRWSYYRGRLTFEVVVVLDAGSRVIYTAHPWRRIGD